MTDRSSHYESPPRPRSAASILAPVMIVISMIFMGAGWYCYLDTRNSDYFFGTNAVFFLLMSLVVRK